MSAIGGFVLLIVGVVAGAVLVTFGGWEAVAGTVIGALVVFGGIAALGDRRGGYQPHAGSPVLPRPPIGGTGEVQHTRPVLPS